MENERLEALNHDLERSVAEMSAERKRLLEATDILTEANRDICEKFEKLAEDLHKQKATYAEIYARHEEAEALIARLQAERREWLQQREAAVEKLRRLEEESREARTARQEMEATRARLEKDLDAVSREHSELKEARHVERQEEEELQGRLREAEKRAEELAQTAARKDCALKELESTDEERRERTREAVERADVAVHERDLARKREKEMVSQVEILAQKLSRQRNEISAQLQSQWQLKVAEVSETARRQGADLSRLRTEAVAKEMEAEQLSHENALLEKRLEYLTSSMTSTQISCSLTGISVQSVAELEKIQALEFERQSAVDDLQELQSKHRLLQKTLDATRAKFDDEAASLRRGAVESQQKKNEAESEVFRLTHEAATLREQLDTERTRHGAAVRQKELQLKALVEKHRAKLEKIDARGTQAMEAMQQRLEEATGILEEKEAMQNKWRDETAKIAQQLDVLAAEHRQENIHFKKHAVALTQELEELRSEKKRLLEQTATATNAAREGERRLAALLPVKTRLELHLSDLEADYGYIQDAYRQARREVEQLNTLLKQTERERDSFGLRYESIRQKAKRSALSPAADVTSQLV